MGHSVGEQKEGVRVARVLDNDFYTSLPISGTFCALFAPRFPRFSRNKLGDRLVETYAGPGDGVQTIKASEWEPVIHTMAHSEFPSASACVCQVCRNLLNHCYYNHLRFLLPVLFFTSERKFLILTTPKNNCLKPPL